MLFAEIDSDAVKIVTLVLAFLGTTITAVMTIYVAKLKGKVEDATVLQTERGEKRDKKIDEVNKVLTDVHLLTNSGMKEVKDELKAARDEIRGLQQAATQKAEVVAAGLAAKGG